MLLSKICGVTVIASSVYADRAAITPPSAGSTSRWVRLGSPAAPVEGGVMAVAADVAPVEAVVRVRRTRGPGGGEAARHEVPHLVDPDLRAVTALDPLDLDVEHVGDPRRALPSLLGEVDGNDARRQPRRDERGDVRHHAPGAARE